MHELSSLTVIDDKLLPFDQKSVPGFLSGILVELIAGWKFSAVLCSINTFYIGVCWYVEACINDLQSIFDEIDAFLTANDGDENNDNGLTKFTLRRSLLEAVDFHKRILSLIENFASLVDGVIFLTFSGGTVWLSTSMAQFMDINIKLFQPAVSNFLILVWLFVYCFYGNLITWKCLQVADFAYHSKFYNYPNDLKIFTLLMMERSQRPFYITGYKITKCSLESYTRFLNTALSFYMLFRNLW
ncbi:uncharacterized protein LOC129571372 [Sitodiplosis mosellana]|uniref:uncharacterized protein LOC129571372 n=1 Tax=Sitodiplosis mosellana TaxID=263140 RepID=UPI0024447900|nr:uncharacterized protein LOC129571372 [Sitodiplosis mosellana]